MTHTIAPTAGTRREPPFPVRQFREQALFAALIWVAYSVIVFIVLAVVSLFIDIEASGWDVASQPARWFAFVIGVHLGWSALQLHVTHGGTRRGFMVQMTGFILAYAAVLAGLYALSFLAESGLYALAGWPQALNGPALYETAFDVPLVLLQSFLVFALWTVGGLFIAAAWYRNGLLGGLAIPLGLVAISVSTYTISGDIGPMNWVRQFVPPRPGIGPTVLAHAAMFAVFVGLAWLVVRDVPIRNKAAAG